MSWTGILANAPQTDVKKGIRYYRVGSRRLLNTVRAAGLPFELSINPYLNCEFACAYCYARDFAHKRSGSLDDFSGKIYAKAEAPEILKRELLHLRRTGQQGRLIAIGTATDPYQPLERRERVTRRVLEVLTEFHGVRVSITTKSDRILRDLDLLRSLSQTGYVRVNISLTTLDRKSARSLEPKAPTPRLRLAAVEALNRAGIPAGIFCMPILPGINDDSRTLRHLMCAAKEAGAQWFATRTLALAPGARAAFLAWLEREQPALVPRYQKLYARGPQAPAVVRERIEALVAGLRALSIACPALFPTQLFNQALSNWICSTPFPNPPPRQGPESFPGLPLGRQAESPNGLIRL